MDESPRATHARGATHTSRVSRWHQYGSPSRDVRRPQPSGGGRRAAPLPPAPSFQCDDVTSSTAATPETAHRP